LAANSLTHAWVFRIPRAEAIPFRAGSDALVSLAAPNRVAATRAVDTRYGLVRLDATLRVIAPFLRGDLALSRASRLDARFLLGGKS
jgi:hypothetical protein